MKVASSVDLENIFIVMVIDMKEIGRMTRKMDLESIFGMMAEDMKGIGKIVKEVGLDIFLD